MRILPAASTADTSTNHYRGPSGHQIKNPPWTAELIERMTVLLLEGKSAGAIAKELGFETRNAIIGKLNRLGLRASRPVATQGTGLSEHATQKRIEKRLLKQVHHRPRVRLIEDITPPSATPEDAEISTTQRCTILELSNTTCRWPVGEPTYPGFFYCGGDADLNAGQPYCRRHTSIACRKY